MLSDEERTAFFNEIYGLDKVLRTGFVRRGVENPENVKQHSGACMLIAAAFLPWEKLPKKYSETGDELYDFMTIVTLLMIHDMGELKTGDIVRGTKTEDQKQAEYDEMKRIIYNFYDGYANPVEKREPMLNLWADFDSGKPKNINAKIAKEIDYIQGSHKYFSYCAEGRVKYTIDDCYEWLNEVSDERIKTKIGREIRKALIYEYPEFKNIDLLQTAMQNLNIFDK